MRRLLGSVSARLWLGLVGASTILLIAGYTLVQQSTRLAANDLPLAAAQTAKHNLETGAEPTDAIPSVKTDMRSDSAVFVIITDGTEHILASSGQLDGRPVLPPAGTFIFTKDHGSDTFTWQPKSGVLLATYMLKYGTAPDDGFIITGQSLKQAEDRIGKYTWLSLAAWLAVLAWVSFILLVPTPKK